MRPRSDDFVAATLRIIVREGMVGVSYRTVAAEAGWSVGALQKLFPRKSDLLQTVLTHLQTASAATLNEQRDIPSARDWLIELTMSVLPVDEARTHYVRIAASFAEHALFDPDLGQALSATESSYRARAEQFLDEAAAAGRIPQGLNHTHIVWIIFSFSGGFASRMLFENLPEPEVRSIVSDLIDSLLTPPPNAG